MTHLALCHASCPPRPVAGRRGVVLLAVLLVTAILMLVGYQFFRLMSAELEAAQAANRGTQSRYLADSGLHYAAFVLSYPQLTGLSDTSDSIIPAPGLLYDNPAVFHLRPVTVGSGTRQGYFSIVSPRDIDDPNFLQQGFRFGVEDESGKINLNAIAKLSAQDKERVRQMIVKLPGMTEEYVAAIFEWVQTQQSGAAGDELTYASMGYAAKRGPLESLEELLLVRGFTPRFLLGNDLNRNGRLEPEEDDTGGVLDTGLSRYLTIYSRERNVDSQGQPRIYLNDTDVTTLWDRLSSAVGEELANFIVGYRLYGQQASGIQLQIRLGSSAEALNGVLVAANSNAAFLDMADGSTIEVVTQQLQQQAKTYGTLSKDVLDLARRPRQTVASALDLIGAEFSVTKGTGRQAQTTWYRSPLQREDLTVLRELLPLVFDKTTTKQEMELTPRININTAPRELLLAFPNIEESQVDHILELRPGPDMDPSQAALYRTPAWLVTEAGFDPGVVKQFEPYITTRSQVYRVQVVGYYDVGGPTVRLEAVIDTNNGRPRFLYWRDLTELGRGFNMSGN